MPLQSGPRMTLPMQLVLRALLAEPTKAMYGLQICTEAGLPSGTLHPILIRRRPQGRPSSAALLPTYRREGRSRRHRSCPGHDSSQRHRTARPPGRRRGVTPYSSQDSSADSSGLRREGWQA
jgi:PadR family transcriptional regulator, regulatory protein PadR